MKKKSRLVLSTVIALSALTTSVFAQGVQYKGSQGWGQQGGYGRMYNPQTVETDKGQVLKVDLITPMKGMCQGVHLLLKTDKEQLSVHLGPSWYVTNQDVQINTGDDIEVTGSRVDFQGQQVIIASQVKKGDQVLVLRDKNGVPMWSGWRNR